MIYHKLTHLPLDKIAAISQMTASNAFSWMESFVFRSKVTPNGLIDNKSALVQVMAWRRAGDKPLPEPLPTQFTDASMRHKGEVS